MRAAPVVRVAGVAALVWGLSTGLATEAMAQAPAATSAVAAQPAAVAPDSRTVVTLGDIDLDGPAINPLTVTVRNASKRPMSNISVTLAGPVGWTVSGTQTLRRQLQPGGSTKVTFSVQVPELRPGFRTYSFSAEVAYRGGDGAGSATGAMTAHSGTVQPNLAAAFNNVGVTDESATRVGNFDGSGNSFSAQKLADVGLAPGASVAALGATFTWPTAAPGTPGNVATAGQAVKLSGKGSRLAFLGSGSNQSATGTATVFYTDGTSSTGSFGFPNWSFQAADAHGATLVASSVGRNRPSGYGDAAYAYRVFAHSIALDSGKTVDFVVLPSNAALHVFDLALVP